MYQNNWFQQYTLLLWSMSTCKGSSNTPLHMGQTNSSSTSPWKRLSSYPILPEIEIKLHKKYKSLGINFYKAEFHLMNMYFQRLGTLNMLYSGTGVLKLVFPDSQTKTIQYISARTKFSDVRDFRSAVNNKISCMNHIDAPRSITIEECNLIKSVSFFNKNW